MGVRLGFLCALRHTVTKWEIKVTAKDLLTSEFALFSDIARAHGDETPDALAVADEVNRLTWGELNRLADRIASRLQREGVAKGDAIAIVGINSVEQVAVILATLRIGAVAGLLTNSAVGEAIAAMFEDTGARHLFLDAGAAKSLDGYETKGAHRIAMDGSDAGVPLEGWIDPEGSAPSPVNVGPSDGFNIIYSSGTTGNPKGIVHSHAMRWQHIHRGLPAYPPRAVTISSTPLYSNTTMAAFLPTLASGGAVVLMKKFDALTYLQLAERERATNTMLVPVQYRRLMAVPEFGKFDLSSFVMKYCTSAPFPAALKADVVARWPGGLVEIYGLTEGGGNCVLEAHKYPDKLHTVGLPAPGHDMRVIDEDANELPTGSVGEIVGRSPAMMTGYNNRPDATKAMQWYDSDGTLFYRHGDIGRFDEDGFLILMDRAKDMIISGGFNIYPSDLESVLATHPGVIECTVVGAPSEEWGETPVGFVVLRDGVDAGDVLTVTNARLGKTQRINRLVIATELPRSVIGKVLKRELRDGL